MYQQENAFDANDTFEEYNKEIRDLLTQGFVRPLTPAEANDGRGWYLEHHAVYREDKSSTKVRIVWNAAAQFRGVSLNGGFHKSPDLLNTLGSYIFAWRRYRVALVGDVKKMFNQIEVAASDQIFHRFVWRFGDENSPPIAFQWLRLSFGDRPAPDTATSSVRMLAEISRQSEPIGSSTIDNDSVYGRYRPLYCERRGCSQSKRRTECCVCTRKIRDQSMELKPPHSGW